MCRQTGAQKGRQVCVSLVIIHIHSTSPGKTKHFKKESPWKRKPERQSHVHAHELACTHAQLKHIRKRNMQTTCTNTRLTVIVSFPQRDVLFTIVVAILNLLPAHHTTTAAHRPSKINPCSDYRTPHPTPLSQRQPVPSLPLMRLHPPFVL